jgi:hypothetical protein
MATDPRYLTLVYAKLYMPEPFNRISDIKGTDAINTACDEMDAELKRLGVKVVPLTGTDDITTELNRICAIWAAGVAYRMHSNSALAVKKVDEAKVMLARFRETHYFKITDVIKSQGPKTLQYGDRGDFTDSDLTDPMNL